MPLQQMALINFFLYVHFKNNKKTNPVVTSLPKQRLALPQPIMKDSITVQCYSNYYKIKKKKNAAQDCHPNYQSVSLPQSSQAPVWANFSNQSHL